MSLVLAVEPDTGQAELLRRLAARLDDVELILVDSAEAVAPILTSRVPRLLLLGASLSEQARALAVDHYILASDSSEPQMLAIPPLSNGETTTKGKSRRKSKTAAGDVEAFAAAIGRCLAAGDTPPQADPLDDAHAGEVVVLEVDALAGGDVIDSAAHAAALATAQELADAKLAAEVERVRREAEERHAVELDRLRADEAASRARAEAAEQLAAQLGEADRLRGAAEERTHAAEERTRAEVERVRREAEERHAVELDRLRADEAASRARAEAAEQLAAQLDEADRLRRAAEERTRAAEERTRAEVERIKSGSAEQLDAELRRAAEAVAAADARAQAAEEARAQAVAAGEEARAQAVAAAEALRTEAESRHEAALARAAAEIEAARQSQDAAQRDAESVRAALSQAQAAHASAMDQARAEAERDGRARAEDAARLESARVESDGRHRAELERAHQELSQVRQDLERAQAAHHSALEQARAEAERTSRAHADEAARAEAARIESDSRHRAELDGSQQELERTRQELNQVRQDMERAQAEHQTAIEQVRAEGERDSRAWADEAVRADTARIESETRLTSELERTHKELSDVRQELEQARTAHRSAIEQARADADRDNRERAAEALRAETARLDAEGRHRTELERAHQEVTRIRQEMEHAQTTHVAAIALARAEAERDSRAAAETAIASAIARLTADAEARIASEVAAVRAEAEERRVAGFAALRAQLDHLTGTMRDAGGEQPIVRPPAVAAVEVPVAAPVVIEDARTAEIAVDAADEASDVDEADMGDEFAPEEDAPASTPMVTQVVQFASRGGRLAAQGLRAGGRTALPVARRVVEWLPGRALPAAMLLLVLGGLALVDVSALAARGTGVALSASRKAASLLGIGARPESDAKDETGDAAAAVADEAVVEQTSAPAARSGLLQVNSRLPLDIYLGGKRIGASGEREIVLPPGRHRVEFVSDRLNYRGEATLTIRSGAFTTHNVALPTGSLLIETEPGAEVIVEGQSAGVSPLGVVSAPLGSCEVVVRHPERGERREVVEVRYGVTTELRVQFPPAEGPIADAIPPA